jgi:2-succinyl-5-enolpyruvyl-6-hydroxy-3-cyclohexene-1-carboxylate synthase
VSEAPFCDLSVFSTVLDRIPGDSAVHLANSTPARYAQLFDRVRGHRWFSNRGTSGIDGCTSTAVGAAFATQRLTTLITGDIAFCYDSNAFWNGHLSPLLKVIVIRHWRSLEKCGQAATSCATRAWRPRQPKGR